MSTPHETIAQKAYELYVREGCQQGHCEKYWHMAEQELGVIDNQTREAGLEMQDEGGPPKPVTKLSASP